MNYILDTCVVSELIRVHPEKKVISWIDSVDERKLYLSVVTIGELEKGIEKLVPSLKKDKILDWLHGDLLVRFSNRILSLDDGIMLKWGQLTGSLEKKGLPMSTLDSLIAATALHYHYCLVTRNESDFINCDLPIFNPWK